MALSGAFVDSHITTWSASLAASYRPYRGRWPARLFHHAPIENAVAILRDGNLRSRNDAQNALVRDIAGIGVIDARNHAHEFGRIYFRPRTPTQWHIEGIRKPGECAHGENAHAPILIMFVFDARSVLLQDGVCFSDRNMQLASASVGDTEAYFSSIPFHKVYHEGDIAGDRSIIDHRCAEVLATSPMSLAQTLQWIYCRTDAEASTLLHMLGPDANGWRDRVLVSDDLLVFDKRFVYVEKVAIARDGVVAQFSPRQDYAPIDIHVEVWSSDGVKRVDYRNPVSQARPPLPSTSWRFPAQLQDGSYLVKIHLEGHLGFASFMDVGNNIFL